MMTSTTIFPRTDQRHYSISVAVVVDYSVAVVVAAADVAVVLLRSYLQHWPFLRGILVKLRPLLCSFVWLLFSLERDLDA